MNIKQNTSSASLADEKKNIHGSEAIIPTQPISNSQPPATDIIDVLMKPEMGNQQYAV